nr:ADP-ribosylglycohydrolase family protein [Allochromatium vinosum]
MLGGALGDAFGYPIEFHRLEQIRQQFGPAGLCELLFTDDQLQVSDDTQMTLFTLEGMVRAGRVADAGSLIDSLSHAYADWLDTQDGGPASAHCRGLLATRPALRQRRAPGNTCLSALQSGRPGTPEQPINDSKGCGAVMRVAPLGWIEPADPRHRFEQAARAGALTHGHPDGWAGGGLLAVLIGELHAGATFTEALNRAKTVTVQTLHARGIQADLLDCIERAEQLAGTDQSPPSAIAQLGHGWVGEEALAIALYAVQRAGSFTEAVRHAANHDGDSDSTASIAGQIWGAWAGLAALPMSWVRRLDVLDEALDLIGALAEQGYRAEPVAGTDAPLSALS